MTLARFLELFSRHGRRVSSPASGAAFGRDGAVKIVHLGALAAIEGLEAGSSNPFLREMSLLPRDFIIIIGISLRLLIVLESVLQAKADRHFSSRCGATS